MRGGINFDRRGFRLRFLLLMAIPLFWLSAWAQPTPAPTSDSTLSTGVLAPEYDSLLIENRLIHATALGSFFKAITDYRAGKLDRVQVVHFGDSHVQMGYWAEQIRTVFDSTWGVAAYGSSFPYHLLRYKTYYAQAQALRGKWSGGVNLLESPNLIHGASGFTLETTDTLAEVSMKLRSVSERLRRFNVFRLLIADSNSSYEIEVLGNNETLPIQAMRKTFITPDGDKLLTYTFENLQDSVRIRIKRPAAVQGKFQLSGVQFDQVNTRGIVYHNFGVGGSQLTSMEKGFERVVNQLELIRPDLILFSFGSNEAYRKGFDIPAYAKTLEKYVRVLHARFPNASILFTTPPDTRFKDIHPRNLKSIDSMFKANVQTGNFACWDLYAFMKKTGGIMHWLNNKLASSDKLHFSPSGYQLQGNVLMHSLLKAYEEASGEYTPYRSVLEEKIRSSLPQGTNRIKNK